MKKLINVLLIAFMLLGLCGCHGQKKTVEFTVPEDFDQTKEYTISFWAKNDTNSYQVAAYRKAAEDFHNLYPNITVEIKLYTDYARIYNDVITNISTNTTPNVCITYPDHIATYLTGQNVVAPLSDLMNDEKYGLGGSEVKFDSVKKEEIVPEFLDECIISNEYYALPYMRSTEALYINKDFVEALGYQIPDVVTWDFIYEVSKKAVIKDSEDNYVLNGQKTLIPFIYKSTDNMMIQMLEQMDADYSDENGNVLIFNDETRSVLKDLADLTRVGAFSTFKISSYPANFLNAGQCIFAIDSTAGSTWMGSKAPLLDIPEEKLVEFETVVRMVPQTDPSNPKMISQGPSICIFNKEDSGEVLASWLFAQYLLTNDVQMAYAQTEGYVPVTLKAQNTNEYQEYLNSSGKEDIDEKNKETGKYYPIKIEATKLLLEHPDYTFTTPVFNGSASLRECSGQLIEETVKGIRRKKTVDDKFFDELYNDMNSLYRLDQLSLNSDQKKDLGELPTASKALIAGIIITWVGIGLYYFKQKTKK